MRWLGLVFVLLVAVPARAESPAEREAREHYTAGQKLFDQARYADALSEFQQSFALSKYPALIYKIALCQDQLGQSAEALASYESYLQADPQSSRRAGVEERIAKLRETLHPAAPEKPRAPAVEAPHTATPAAPSAPTTAVEKKTPAYKKWWVWTLVGVVAAGAAVGLGVGLTQAQTSSFTPTLPAIGPAALRY